MNGEQTAAISWVQRAGERLSDFVNPIAVKEMRQAVAGRVIAGVIVLFLVVQTGVVAMFLLWGRGGGSLSGDGGELFMMFMTILLATCLLFVPASTAYRLGNERSEQNVDLMFITTLRPWRIISGKFFSAMMLTVLVYSLCLPFITLAYLLRGIDMQTVFTLLGASFVVVAWCVMLAIFVASLPMGRLLRGLAQLGCLGVFLWVFGASVMVGSEMVAGYGWYTAEEWAWFLGFTGATILMMFTLAVAAVSPPTSNRAVMPRTAGFVLWAALGVATIYFAPGTGAVAGWGWLAAIGLLAALMVATSERDHLNRRLQAKVPRNPLVRVPAFLFFSGAANGVVWAAVMLVATVVLLHVYLRGGGFFVNQVAVQIEVFAWFIVAYGLLGFMIARLTPLSRLIQPTHTFAVGLIFASISAVAPVLIAVVSGNMMRGVIPDSWWWASPVAAFMNDDLTPPLVISRIAAAAMLVAVSPWLLRRMAAFKPPQRKQPVAAPEAAPEPAEQEANAALQPAVVTEEAERG